jgi:hypothetical protein
LVSTRADVARAITRRSDIFVDSRENDGKGLAASVGRWRRAIDEVADVIGTIEDADLGIQRSLIREAAALYQIAEYFDPRDEVNPARSIPQANSVLAMIERIRGLCVGERTSALLPEIEQPVFVSIPESFSGNWTHAGRGDKNMDVDDNIRHVDIVRPRVTSTVTLVGANKVRVTIIFGVKEDGGDGTEYGGERFFEHTISTPAGYKVSSVSPLGPLSFTGSVRGHRAHVFQPLGGIGGHWSVLEARCDAASKDDQPFVGIRGTLQLIAKLSDASK